MKYKVYCYRFQELIKTLEAASAVAARVMASNWLENDDRPQGMFTHSATIVEASSG